MAQKTINTALGLRSYKNELIQTDGSLITANNVIIDRDNVIEPRRGFNLYGDFGDSDDLAKQILQYKDTVIVHYDDKLLYDDGEGNFTEFYGTYEELSDGLRIKGIETSGNFYFTTSNGVKKISVTDSSDFLSTSGFITDAGAVKALDGYGTADTDTPGFMTTQTAAAYRVLWGYTDENDLLVLGAPCEYFIVRNLSSTDSAIVNLTFTIPDEIIDDSKWFYQIYRSELADDSGTGSEETTYFDFSSQSTATLDGKYVIIYDDAGSVGVWFNLDSGSSEPVTGADRTIEVGISSGDTNESIALKFSSAMNTDSEFTSDTTSGTTAEILSITIGSKTDASNGDTSLAISITDGTTSISVGSTTPEDELNLVFEDYPTDDDFTNGYVSTTDITPEDFRDSGASLYTNSISGDGILQANDRPPLCEDIATYKGSTFYANTKTKHQMSVSLLSADLLNDGDTITIGDENSGEITYTFSLDVKTLTDIPIGTTGSDYELTSLQDHRLEVGDSITIASTDSTPAIDGTYEVTAINATDDTKFSITYTTDVTVAGTTGGYFPDDGVEKIDSKVVLLASQGSVSQNIDDTARSLQRVINRNSGVVYVFYLSGPTDVPGELYLEARELEDIPFYVKVDADTDGSAFNPTLPTDDSEESTNTVKPNRVYFSKDSQPESVPILNYFDVGEKDKSIQRIVALRDSLFILKGDGIYRLSGSDVDTFSVSLQDASSTIIAADSVAVLNNQIFMLSTQGIVSIAESGYPSIVSREIEDLILEPTSNQYTNFSTATFGIGYESDRSYIIHLPTNTTDTVATQAYRYNVFTEAWTRYFSEKSKTCGLVSSSDNKIYLGVGDTNYIEQERKDFERTDYADREYSNSISTAGVDGTTLTLSTLDNTVEADTVYQEMYITISRFNRLLRKLDNDIGLNDTDYNDTLEISAGDALNNQIMSLVLKISEDDTEQTYTTPSGSNDFDILRDEFNTLADELNTSSQTFYASYRSYTDSVSYESIILDVSTSGNDVEVVDEIPFLQGAVTIFESIVSEIEWTPITLDEPSLMKHFSEATIMFDQYTFNIGTVEFRSDIADAYEGIEFTAEGNGAYGSQIYGETVFGGSSNQRPFRTYVPRNKQRCRFIIVKFTHQGSRESYAITGYSVTYKAQATQRAYKR